MLDRPHFSRAVRALLNTRKFRPPRGGAAVFFGLAGLIGWHAVVPDQVWSTHEMDHRFAVSGYVKDKDGRPVKDARVFVRDLGDQSVDPVTTYADGSGFYKALLHLHNKNAGDTIQVSVKDDRSGFDEVKKTRAEFNPGDRHSERQTRVNFGPESETSSDGLGGVIGTDDQTKYWLYAAGGVLVLAAVGAAVLRSRSRRPDGDPKRRRKKR